MKAYAAMDYEGSRSELVRLLADVGEVPAFVRRAEEVQHAWDALLDTCRRQHEPLLQGPRLRMMLLTDRLQGDWDRVAGLLRDAQQVDVLRELHQRLGQQRPAAATAVPLAWSLAGALTDFRRSIARFNQRWEESLQQINLAPINRLRHDYNVYYPIEKACAFGSEHIGRLGFEPLAPVTIEELRRIFPLLPEPQLR